MNTGIYKITNNQTGSVYVGSSENLNKRIPKHFYELRKGKHVNNKLQKDFNIFGEENFIVSIILYCEKSELIEYEQFFVNTLDPFYNIWKEDVNSKKGVLGQKYKNSISKYLGVSYNGTYRKWTTQISFQNKLIWVGEYDIELDAAVAYDRKAIELFGSKAILNFDIDFSTNYILEKKEFSSKYRGVVYAKRDKSWRAEIRKDNVRYYLGSFENEIDPAKAYDLAAIRLYGNKARLNFP